MGQSCSKTRTIVIRGIAIRDRSKHRGVENGILLHKACGEGVALEAALGDIEV